MQDVLALIPTLAAAPGEGTELARLVRESEYTEEVACLAPGESLVFDALDVPGGAELTLSLRVEVPGPREPPDAIQVDVRWSGADGNEFRKSSSVPLRGAPTQHWFEYRLERPENEPLQRLELAFTPPPGTSPGARTLVLRPRLRWNREVAPAREDARRVLIVTMDTLRADHLGCYGSPDARSPEIDSFAADAVRFEHCYSTSNVTTPSHASLFTSLHLKDHEVRDNFTRLSLDVPNIATALRERGFLTAAFVSSHNFEPGTTGFEDLFEEFHASHGRQRRAEDVHVDLLPWLTENRDREFFAWVHYYDVHAPYDPPYPYNAAFPYRGQGPDPAEMWPKPPWHQARRDLAHARAQYLGEIEYLDARFGELVDHLRALSLLDGTLIAVTSDHGESLGEHGVSCMHKGLHETTTRVPLIVRVPSGPRGVVLGLSSLLDVWPTLFDYLDLPLPGAVRGVSLRAAMESGESIDRERVFSESDHGTQIAVRTREHRAILGLADRELTPRLSVVKDRLELFATTRDPDELRDLAAARGPRAQELREALLEFLEDSMALGAAAVADEEFRREMEKLGYTD